MRSMQSKLERIRSLATKVGKTVSDGDSPADLAVPALCSVIFDIASRCEEPEFGRRTAESLRAVALLLEQHQAGFHA